MERIPARQRETAKIQAEMKAFVREMVRDMVHVACFISDPEAVTCVIAPDGSLRTLKHFVIELKGSVRRIALSELTEETPLDELCATLSGECISFSFEDISPGVKCLDSKVLSDPRSRERFAMCLQILVDGQQ
ncbi:unnamed protein product [Symbiodinium necroappetens]|uniref:Uncharacterized protein n=1 Tax=Symbiodinium necroappetens TaxID=1628268 RepID=A0A813C4N8_9DINO|nr:unnamed protein product [Symbiodinium necroappetens]